MKRPPVTYVEGSRRPRSFVSVIRNLDDIEALMWLTHCHRWAYTEPGPGHLVLLVPSEKVAPLQASIEPVRCPGQRIEVEAFT